MPGRASMRLYMNAGSLMEEDDQQGMAHFLEHMAFNGSRNFPAGTSTISPEGVEMDDRDDEDRYGGRKETCAECGDLPGAMEVSGPTLIGLIFFSKPGEKPGLS
jgi:predicted Zn-dependent peptidase